MWLTNRPERPERLKDKDRFNRQVLLEILSAPRNGADYHHHRGTFME